MTTRKVDNACLQRFLIQVDQDQGLAAVTTRSRTPRLGSEADPKLNACGVRKLALHAMGDMDMVAAQAGCNVFGARHTRRRCRDLLKAAREKMRAFEAQFKRLCPEVPAHVPHPVTVSGPTKRRRRARRPRAMGRR